MGSGPPLENHKAIGFLSNTHLDPLKIIKLPSLSIQCLAIISMPAKCHLNSVLLVGRCWPAYNGILILSPLIDS